MGVFDFLNKKEEVLYNRTVIPVNESGKIKSCYISAPFEDSDGAKKRINEIKKKLVDIGYYPVSWLDFNQDKEQDFKSSVCSSINIMLNCDCVIFLQKWQQSCRCKTEFDTAQNFRTFCKSNIEIYFEK